MNLPVSFAVSCRARPAVVPAAVLAPLLTPRKGLLSVTCMGRHLAAYSLSLKQKKQRNIRRLKGTSGHVTHHG